MDKLKNIGFGTVFIVFLGLMTNNTKKQLDGLINARKENRELRNKIEIQEKINSDLERRIRYATESAYFTQQQARDKLGLGGANDYWVKVDNTALDLFPQMHEEVEVPVWRQWWNLFTK